MPLDYLIDHKHSVVVVKGRGAVVAADLSAYEQKLGKRRDTEGYNVLIDLSEVEEIEQPSADQIRTMAGIFDRVHSHSKPTPCLAIAARTDFLYGLARMFQGFREADTTNPTTVAVFRDLQEAKTFLALPAHLSSEQVEQP